MTGRAPSSDHIAISIAPVSEAGTMPMRWPAGHAQHPAGQLDRMAEPRLAELRAVRAAERAEREMLGAPARRLGAGSGRKKGTRGRTRLIRALAPAVRLIVVTVNSPRREHAPRWDGVARRRP